MTDVSDVGTDRDVLDRMIAWRRDIHSHPELGFKEARTASLVADVLESLGLEVERGIGGTGVVGTLRVGAGNRAIGLRADMDALEITEASTFAHASRTAGHMHACGHDGHTAMLLGAATMLARTRDFDGTVRFVFQPAEEHGRGAKAMLAEGLVDRFPMEEIYGVHNMPGMVAGQFRTRAGGIMAAEDNFHISVRGRGCHAARPHMGVDAIVVAAEIVLSLQTIVARNVDPSDLAVVSVTEMGSDGIRNVLPGEAWLSGDTRSYSPEVSRLIETRMRALVDGVCAAHGAIGHLEYTREFAPTINTPECVSHAVAAAAEAFGEGNVAGECAPFLTSEDFGAFLEAIPGNYALIGNGAGGGLGSAPLHSDTYDFNDELLLPGATYFATIARRRLPVMARSDG